MRRRSLHMRLPCPQEQGYRTCESKQEQKRIVGRTYRPKSPTIPYLFMHMRFPCPQEGEGSTLVIGVASWLSRATMRSEMLRLIQSDLSCFAVAVLAGLVLIASHACAGEIWLVAGVPGLGGGSWGGARLLCWQLHGASCNVQPVSLVTPKSGRKSQRQHAV
jgi:hypothetical protein